MKIMKSLSILAVGLLVAGAASAAVITYGAVDAFVNSASPAGAVQANKEVKAVDVTALSWTSIDPDIRIGRIAAGYEVPDDILTRYKGQVFATASLDGGKKIGLASIDGKPGLVGCWEHHVNLPCPS